MKSYIENVKDMIKDADAFIKYLEESNDSYSDKQSMYLSFLQAMYGFYQRLTSERVWGKIKQYKVVDDEK